MKTLSALIPCFNEERTLGELIRQLDALPKGVLTECIFIDDGSTDSSLNLLRDALSKVPFKYRIITKKNGGKRAQLEKAQNFSKQVTRWFWIQTLSIQ